jgi:hypothetical protein
MNWISALVSILLLSSLAAAPTTKPAADDGRPLEVRAAAAFNSGNYAEALPMLRTLENDLRDQPDRLGPVREQIRVCVTQLAQTSIENGGIPPQDAPITNEQRKPHAAPKDGEVRQMQIKDLGNFEYDADKGGNIPADVQKLSGSTIRLNGYMIPIDQAENITSFALVPSLFACCFGQPPQVQHTVICKAPAGKAVSYYPDELVVEGKLKVEEKKDEGFIVSLFEVEVASVKPTTR